jgi:hypothetical protein
MTQPASNPSFINNSARCTHFYPNGRRCRLSATTLNSHFCPAHHRLPQNQPEPAEIASTLIANLDDFTSAAQINNFLSRLLLLLAQDKISNRRAAVLAYVTNQLLRTSPPSPRRKTPNPRSSSTLHVPTATAPRQTKIPRNPLGWRSMPQIARPSPHELLRTQELRNDA